METKTFDGINLYYEKSIVKDPVGTIVIVHGIGENLRRYDLLTEKLNSEGYIVYRFDLRGHGLSGGKRGYVKSFKDFLADTDLFVTMQKEEYPKQKHFLMGHSMGGFIVNAYGVTYQNKVDGIISSAAPAIYMKMTKPLRYVPYHLLGFMNKKNNLGTLLSHDPNVLIEYEKSPLNLKKLKFRLLGEMFDLGVGYLQKNIKAFTYPVLYLHGSSDAIVEVESSKWLYQNSASKDKDLIIYEGMYHEILNEVEKDKVIKDILNWLKRH